MNEFFERPLSELSNVTTVLPALVTFVKTNSYPNTVAALCSNP